MSVHVSNILGKMGASGRTEAAAIARRGAWSTDDGRSWGHPHGRLSALVGGA